MSLLDACRLMARRRFSIKQLRPEQEAAMMATGFGKSLNLPGSSDDPGGADDPRFAAHRAHRRPGGRPQEPRGAPGHAAQPAAPGRASRCARQDRAWPPPDRPYHTRDGRIGRDRTPDRARPPVAPVRRRGPLHLGSGGTTSGRPTCGSALCSSGWVACRRLRSRRPRRRVCARTTGALHPAVRRGPISRSRSGCRL
jgi:hypothetical protein